MRVVALVLLLAPPLPVTSIGAVINPDDSVTISWTLPVDPSVVGVTIIRDRLDVFEINAVYTLTGTPTSDTDATALVSGSYRYWVYTRNGGGELSTGAFAEVIGKNSGVFVGSTSSSWFCFAAADGLPAWPLFLASALLLSALIRNGR